MHRRSRFRPGGSGGGGRGQPPPHPSPSFSPLNFNPNFAYQDPSFQMQNLLLNSLPQQNPNFLTQNPNFAFQNPHFAVQNTNYSPPIPPRPQFSAQPLSPKVSKQSRQQERRELMERADRAAEKARRELIESGESVTAWKVSQAVLVTLQVDSWDSLGFRIQEVPSLYRLVLTESKINSFIHCFVAVWRITTLYDLGVAICKSEGVEQFEELELGPLVRHPLVLHYFSLSSKVTKVFKITAEEIIVGLSEYMNLAKGKEIIIDEFVEFLTRKRPVLGSEELGVRIQSLGLHISFIREAIGSEKEALKSCRKALKRKSDKKGQKRPLLASMKKELDERFSSICERVESFSSLNKDFCGKHTKFVSASSEDEESDDVICEDDMNISIGGQARFSSKKICDSEHVSGCPYPSATEEIKRLGLRGEISDQSSPVSGSSKQIKSNKLLKKKRKFEDVNCSVSAPSKLLRGDAGKQSLCPIENDNKTQETIKKDDISLTQETINEADFSLSSNTMRVFITTWKEACREQSVAEVLQRLIRFYKPRGYKVSVRYKKTMKSVFSSYPGIGLLNVAVTSIKCGMWDSIYDTFQAISHHELNNINSPEYCEVEKIDVEPVEHHIAVVSEHTVHESCSVTVEEIIQKITRYYELDHEVQSNGKSLLESKFVMLRKLCNCEFWLVNQFGVTDFKCLGYGEFFVFLEKHFAQLPAELREQLAGKISEKFALEVCLQQNQLVSLVSQASNSLWENDTITKQMISSLLVQQFPLLSFKIMGNDAMEDFLEIVGKYKNNVISNCILFSASLHGGSLALKEDYALETTVLTNSSQKTMPIESVTSQDAVEVLLRAPMLFDLNLWSHWDLIFAPSLGPLMVWLLSEANTKELLCLVTKHGKVIRIDPSATADSFLEAALQGLSYKAAVKLLSLFSLAGGEKHVPLSLLKCYARRAFEVILSDHCGNIKLVDENASHNLIGKLQNDPTKMNNMVSVASRFVLDCLGYIPSEFHGFAADVLLSGMKSVMKDANSAILAVCIQNERLMLHEIGLSLGIFEWIDDYNTFCATDSSEFFISSVPSYLTAVATCMPNILDTSVSDCEEVIASHMEEAHNKDCTEVSQTIGSAAISNEEIGKDCGEQLSDDNKSSDAILLIESIRRDEFGLHPNLSNVESGMLKKQHARLGRALHCLSQELYSQDSHFLLELVQNADDNIYLENVEPTLTFILRDSGIVVLNNEQGFSAQNIRALCDVGNSTKKGSGSGYIGQKGIGFKSVFRVTDAPEIHSNGFHIKFDIGEGQIGFVLPTAIPPCNIELFSKLLSGDADQISNKCWNTCIVLPFLSKFSGETAMKMFADLHPSLLLFLHRLRCIMFRNMLNNSIVVMKKETMEDGIVKVSCGNDKMTWLVASQKLEAHVSRPKVQATEIAIAFTLEESDNGVYSPHLNQQPVFAFLPLRTYGLKFILQGDFVLPSSREEVDKNNPWNEWLLTKFPALFVSAEKYFCALSCYKENPGKAVAAFMSFVPLVGEVHGFFSGLPKAIILELRRTGCLLLEGDNSKLVPPCNVLRGWNEQACNLLPAGLIQQHLGLGFMDKDIILSDSLARALGIAEYGPEILVRFMSCLCRMENGLKSMGLVWLSSWLNTLYTMISHSSEVIDIVSKLRHIPLIPLSDGTYSSVDAGTIWLHSDVVSIGFNSGQGLESFPNLCSKLRIVNPLLLSASSVEGILVDNITGMLHSIGVQQLSAHEIIKVNILPAISDDRILIRDKNLMIDYLCFVMNHLQYSCHSCYVERKYIISELQRKAYILTNHGFKRLLETPIHFSREFQNPINVDILVDLVDMEWHEVDVNYLKHPASESLSNGLIRWREFFQEIGVTDFVQVVQIDKSFGDLSHTIFEIITLDMDLISSGSVVKDWESHELVHLLSLLSTSGDRERCKYLLEVLDTLCDHSFSDKAIGYYSLKCDVDVRSFTSSFLCNICDVQWVASSLDNKLHHPKELFYDCDAVSSLLGASAPYAVPKVKSEKLLRDIGFKTRVTLDDVLQILEIWRRSDAPFKASIAQMTKFYSFICDEMVASKNKILETIHAGPFIFVPCETGSRQEDLVPGIFLSSEEVYWNDPTGSVDQMKGVHHQCGSTALIQHSINKSLCNIYPGLHHFFVKECGVRDFPTWSGYLDILQQLSTVAVPSQASSVVFQVFLKWTDELKSGLLSSEDIVRLKECLMKLECTILPTVQDKWVSLHPCYGMVCWCDDKKLAKRFKNKENIDLLYLGSLNDHEQEMLQTKMCVLLQNLGIPALSEVITREAIYYGPADSSTKVSLINWALPYAQRYIYSVHREKYFQLKQSGFDSLKQLEIVVVEELFYRNTIKGSSTTSDKRYECNCLLQGNTLYAKVESNSHDLFLELSRLFFDGTPDLHVANFLHMITTMAESGSSEEKAEFFIVNSQNVPKLPDEESVWSLSSITHLTQAEESLPIHVASVGMNEEKASKSKKKAGISSNWPPVDWKTAPDFNYARANGFKTQAGVSHPSSLDVLEEDNAKDIVTVSHRMLPTESGIDFIIEESNAALDLPDMVSENMENHVFASNQTPDIAFDLTDLHIISDRPESSSRFLRRDQLHTGTANTAQAMMIGRLGEHVAYKYLSDKLGKKSVIWVNEDNETGLPYDIVVGEDEGSKEYIEVKATKSARKDWFTISMREWQYAIEKGEFFSILHVVLLGNNAARVTTFRNAVRQCQQGKLQLAVIMPNQQGLSIDS